MQRTGAPTTVIHGAPARAVTQTGFARVTGTVRDPRIELHIHPKLSHPTQPGTSMKDWVKSLGYAMWDPHARAWTVPFLGGLTPSQVLAEAGIELNWDERPEQFADIPSIDHLAYPIAKLTENRRIVMVRPRLCGYEITKQLIGVGSVWDGERLLFRIDAADVLAADPNGQMTVRPGVAWPQDAIHEAAARHHHTPVDPLRADLARRLSTALGTEGFTPEEIGSIGIIPDDARTPYQFQAAGSLAVAAGRVCLFDEPGVGKTATSLYAARVLGSQRTLIVVPPLLTTNWQREIAHAGLAPADQVVVYRAGRKERDLPEIGAVIVPDSLLASRPALREKIIGWAADVMIVDEAHRLKTIGSKRGDAVLDVGMSVRHPPIVLTGTPIFSGPHELITMLELTRVMAPVFGGRHQYLSDFCVENGFGGWGPRKSALGRLHATLREHVWVRRRKKDVLSQLPPKRRQAMLMDVPLKDYRETHKQVIGKVHSWMTWFYDQNGRKPTAEEYEDWSRGASITLISQLRQAAGIAKIPKATEWIQNHVEEAGSEVGEDGIRRFNRPLIVWVHHKRVAAALYDAIPDTLGSTAMIGGTTSSNDRDRIVDAFQDGQIAVLVASILKAGVGLTLTRGADAIFVEPTWVNAEITQAEDRFHRVGQEANACLYTTLVARGTLDETIQNVLGRKNDVLEKALGDSPEDSVVAASGDDARALKAIVLELIDTAQQTWKPGAGSA